jgi:hypothetical protein
MCLLRVRLPGGIMSRKSVGDSEELVSGKDKHPCLTGLGALAKVVKIFGASL